MARRAASGCVVCCVILGYGVPSGPFIRTICKVRLWRFPALRDYFAHGMALPAPGSYTKFFCQHEIWPKSLVCELEKMLLFIPFTATYAHKMPNAGVLAQVVSGLSRKERVKTPCGGTCEQ